MISIRRHEQQNFFFFWGGGVSETVASFQRLCDSGIGIGNPSVLEYSWVRSRRELYLSSQ